MNAIRYGMVLDTKGSVELVPEIIIDVDRMVLHRINPAALELAAREAGHRFISIGARLGFDVKSNDVEACRDCRSADSPFAAE